MPHRDPETGQFVADSHSEAWASADDVLTMDVHSEVGDTSVTSTDLGIGATKNNTVSLEMQKDYRLLGLEAFLFARPDNTEVAGTTTAEASLTEHNVYWQLATTSSFAEAAPPDQGGSMPVGVIYQNHTKAASDAVWEDETNGTGGVRPGYGTSIYEVVPAEKIVNADVTPDAGTGYNLHLKTSGQDRNAQTTRHSGTFRFYVAEREDN